MRGDAAWLDLARAAPYTPFPLSPAATASHAGGFRDLVERAVVAAAVMCGYARQQDTEHAGEKGERNPAARLSISV